MNKDLFVKVVIQLHIFISIMMAVFFVGEYRGTLEELHRYEKYLSERQVIEMFIVPIAEKDIIKISSNQGLREMISISETGGSTSGMWHNAIDFACLERTRVNAAKSGRVISVYPSYYNGQKWKGHKSYGGLVIIEHEDSTVSLYAHLSKTSVNEGDYVYQGDQIGLSGGIKGKRGSGLSTGAHLHFAIYPNISDMVVGLDLSIDN